VSLVSPVIKNLRKLPNTKNPDRLRWPVRVFACNPVFALELCYRIADNRKNLFSAAAHSHPEIPLVRD